jgi:4-amino-4-deoxy-L-arabinose transferase-like glycosyltransferase
LARHPFALLALLGLLLWLPGILSLPALDRDESRFAQSSRQMVESGDLVDIRFGQVPRYKKPAGIYWLQAAATGAVSAVTHDDSRIWTYRLPSLLGGIAAAWATLWCALAVAGAEASLLAGLLMLFSVLLAAEASIATTDAVLLAAVLGFQGMMLRVYRAAHDDSSPKPGGATVMAGWAAFAVGILVKGPVVAGVAAATILPLLLWDLIQHRRRRWLRGLHAGRGLALTLVLVLPWLIAIALASHGAFFQQSLGNDFAAKLAGGQESHGLPPGYYLALSTITFWPAILFVLPALVAAFARRAEPGIRFLLAWAGGWWLLVELVPTKLPHYVLPAYPALAIVAALCLLSPPWTSRGLTAARIAAGLQFLVGGVVLAVAPWLLPRLYGTGAPWWLAALAGLGGVLALAALAARVRDMRLAALGLMLAAALVLIPALTAGAGPRLQQLWVSERLKPLVAAHSRPGDPPPALAGFTEPSLVFALGKDVVLADGAGAAEAGAERGGLALIEDRARGAFLARLAELEADAVPVASLSGFNYSRGKAVHVTLYRVGAHLP